MQMAETTKLDPLESDRITATADSFVIHMDAFSSSSSSSSTTTTTNPPPNNSRITLQRSLSRKGSQRVGESRKVNGNATLHDKDNIVPATSSPRGGAGSCTPGKASLLGVGSMDHSITPHIHHQIPMTPTATTASETGKSLARRNSFRRPSSWALDPKRVKHGNNVAYILNSYNQ